jgi:hypothetical protein
MENKSQTFANHTRYDPLYHFFLLPVGLAAIIVAIYHLIRTPGISSVLLLLLSLAVGGTIPLLRSYPLRVQDRVIRLEERLRLASVLPETLRARIGELSDSQLIGLRFASDAELPGLVERALTEKLGSKDIKKAIVNWRADHLRV